MAVGTTPVDAVNLPLSCVIVPGTTTPVAIQGGNSFTDANSNVTAPARFEIVGGSRATYTYSINALAALAAHTDMFIVRGSATKLVKVIHVELSGAATAATDTVWFLKKHTIANTGGSGTTGVATKNDSNDGAATAVIQTYQTTLPTIDVSATLFRSIRLALPVVATGIPDRYIMDFGLHGGEPIVLRGIAQEFALNLGGGTIPGGEVVDFTVVWTEE